MASAAVGILLRNLSRQNTTTLLASIFGDVPQLQLLSDRLFNISQARLGAVLQCAQHLVDRGVIRYQAGAWGLPHHFEADDLPDSLSETLNAKIADLSCDALKLAQTLALHHQQSFTHEECLMLIGTQEKITFLRILDELRAKGIGSTDGHNASLSHPGWVSILL